MRFIIRTTLVASSMAAVVTGLALFGAAVRLGELAERFRR